jgi:dihydroorotase
VTSFGSLTDAPASFLLAGVRIVDPSTETDEVGDLAVVDGVLTEPARAPASLPRLDGAGLLAIPALCDLHAHLRDPGDGRTETIESGTRAAAHGGYATVCVMPNTDPPLDELARVAMVLELARAAACHVRVVAAATRGREGERMTDVGELASLRIAGVSDDGAAVASARLAKGILAYLAPLELPLIEHAEEPTLAAGTLMRAGSTATRLGLSGWPGTAELSIVERDIGLAEETGAWVHLTHLSTASAIDAVRRAKARGARVTCDVTPHHLSLTDAWVAGDRGFAWEEPTGAGADPFGTPLDPALAYDSACRVNPPLPPRDDALALLAGVADGTVDAIATDHAPHPAERKAVEFAAAAPGMIGLETALSVGLAAVAASRLSLPQLVAAMATRPAALIGEERSLRPGQLADLTVVDPLAGWRVERATLTSGSTNTPLLGMELPGVVRLTVASGRATYRDGLDLPPSS